MTGVDLPGLLSKAETSAEDILARVRAAVPVLPVTFLIVPSRGLLGRPARYDLLPLSYG